MATDFDTTNHTVTEVYSSWINSCLQSQVSNLKEDFKDGTILCRLIEVTTGTRLLSDEEDVKEENTNNVSKAINFIKGKGIEVNDDCIDDINQGDLKVILDLLWLIILNFDIHNHNRAAYQRSVSMGKRFLVEWIARELPDVIVDPKGNFVQSFQNGFLLSRIISKYCETKDEDEQSKKSDSDEIEEILVLAERQLGVPSSILSAALLRSGNVDEYTLLIYLAILRRKICEKKGEEVFKGSGSPVKHPTPQSTPVKTTPKVPNTGMNGQSPLSPAALQKLVEQQTKSHEAIQALQAKLQAINYHPFSPKLLKGLPRTPAPEMPPIFGLSCDQANRKSDSRSSIDSDVKLNTDLKGPDIEEIYDRNFLHSMLDAVQDYLPDNVATSKEKLSSKNEKNCEDQAEKLSIDTLSSQNKQTDAAEKLNTEHLSSKSDNNDEAEVEKLISGKSLSGKISEDGGVCSIKFAENSKENKAKLDAENLEVTEMPETSNEEITDVQHSNEMGNVGDNYQEKDPEFSERLDVTCKLEESDKSEKVKCEKLPKGNSITISQEMTNENGEKNNINSEVIEPTKFPTDNNSNNDSANETTHCQEEIAASSAETAELNNVNLNKHVKFSGLDTVCIKTNDCESNSTISETISPNISSSPKDLSFCDDSKTKDSSHNSSALKNEKDENSAVVTWASLGIALDNDYEPASHESSMIFDDENDQFMVYLNSIEQTALKFKLQVEQAKIDTLQILKKRLEQAYEGTPLEEIPAKVHEKLQETIAQIATEEVKKYESVLSADIEDEFDQDECGILEQMRAELDILASENARLNQELASTKKYETDYHELQKKIEGMEDGLTSMKHDYATKNGESEFLGKQIEALEQEMMSMRVEYEEQIRELQNQNIDLQKECLDLDNENRTLEDEIRRLHVGLSDYAANEEISREQDDEYLAERITVAELEAVEMRVNELERHNKALKAAGEADHAVVVCLEKKVEELESTLNEAKSANSDLLRELHDSQRQQASDRAKLSSYREELEALKRENRVLKNSLESAENEVQYQKRKNEREKTKTSSLTRSPGSLGNKREIWNEIRELETILKDVQKEKVTIEKKYRAFRKDGNDTTSSLNNTPRESTLNLSSSNCNSPVTTARTSPESTLPRPKERRTSTLLERVNSLLEKSSLPNGTTLPHSTKSHSSAQEKEGKSVTGTPQSTKKNAGVGDELSSLRKHVGSLEAEKALILRELSEMRTPKKDEDSSC